MTSWQKWVKYLAMALAVILAGSIIGGLFSVTGLLGGLFFRNTGDMKTYAVTSEICNLNIKIKAAEFCIKEGDSFSVESNLKRIKVEEKGGVLIVEETGLFGNGYNGAALTVYVPAGTVFVSANIEAGAGKTTFETLSAQNLHLELGAGEVSIGTLIATKSANIEGGAGSITVSDGALQNLELEMGLGKLDLTAALTGECQLELGIGESNITLIGSKDDYKLDLEKGIGSITVDGKKVSDYGSSGANEVEISGGIGGICVTFRAESAQS